MRVSDSLQVENMHFNGWQRDNIIVVEGSTERNGQIFKEQRNFFLQDKKLRLDIGNMWIALQPISCPTQ